MSQTITTPCIYCASQAADKPWTFWATRGLDWPTTEFNGATVHLACLSHLTHAVESFDGARVESGALVWQSNGRAPFDDMLALWVSLGLATQAQREATAALRDRQTAQFVANYRANPPKRSAEDIAEMRAAFGPGETVVDVITGQRITL